tara:strand:- start:1666 stop:4503 length:2838 start_codon:yes stop_codon:yes gene_type:complete
MDIINRISNAAEAFRGKREERKASIIQKKTMKQQLYRFNQEITQWKRGIEAFEDPHNTNNTEIIRVYNDTVLDAHLTAVMEARITRTTSKNHKVLDDKGEEIEDQTALLSGAWFRDFLKLSLESKFFGYSLIQFGNQIGQSFEEVELVPREYVYQQKKAVKKHPDNIQDTVPYDKGAFMPWVIGVGKKNDLGLLLKAAPLVIFKKSSFGSWSEFGELFGAPFRMGKTNIRDKELHNNMYDMLLNMGRAAFGVFDKDDELEFIANNQTDAYEVFDKLIERANSEISKLVTGSTMTTDDGSSRSQSEVHERTSASLSKEDAIFVEDVVNKQLIPFLNTYHGFNITGSWAWDDSENTSKKDQFDIDIKLIENGYDLPFDYITETYGTPIDGRTGPKPEPEGPKPGKKVKVDDVENAIKKKILLAPTYKDFIQTHSCDICNEAEGFEGVKAPNWTNVFINDIIEGIYSGKYTPGSLPRNLYKGIADKLSDGLFEGLADSSKLNNIPNPSFANSLRNNAFVFSGAKTFQQVKVMSDFLVDAQGNTRSFKEYRGFAEKTFDDFNVNWLKTEINQAKGSAQMAEKWRQIDEEKDIFPYLKYVTVGDARVREDHQVLDGTIKEVDNKFWDEMYPKNGWNCRCTVQQIDEAVETPDADITRPDVPDYMQFNSGKQKALFSPEHPYFIVEDQFKAFKKDNFGLPTPKQLTKTDVIKEVVKNINLKSLEGFVGNWKQGELTGDYLAVKQEIEKHLGFEVPDKLIKNANPNLTVKTGVGYYLPGPKVVTFGKRTKDWRNSVDYRTRIVAHEVGHSIDNNLGIVKRGNISKGYLKTVDLIRAEVESLGGFRKLNDAIYLDYRKYQRLFNEALKTGTPAEILEYDTKFRNIMTIWDTLGDLTVGRYGGGHSRGYYASHKLVEVFAHLSENYFVGNDYFKKTLPKSYKAGIKYFDKLLKD